MINIQNQKIVRSAKFATAAALLFFSLNASAGVALTYDGLDWLALTDTQGDSVATALAANTGYRHATVSEVTSMWSGQYGMSLGFNLAANYPGAENFINDFGCTGGLTCGGTLPFTYGILDDGGAGSPYGLGFVKARTTVPDGTATISSSSLPNGGAFYGHFLVKKGTNVPEPATLSLLGLGLLGLSFMRRRRAA